jgi:hypothetical protein
MKHGVLSKMFRGMFLAVVVASLIPSLSFSTGRALGKNRSAVDTQARARELWEQAVAAKGGRDKLRGITSLYVASVLPGGDRDYGFYIFPNYSFDYSYWRSRESTNIKVYNAKRAITWWLPRESAIPRKSLPDDGSSNIIAQFMYLMVTSWLDPKPLRTRKERIGLKGVDVVEVDANGWRVDYYLDPKTFLPIQVVSAYGALSHEAGEMEQVVRLDDYSSVDGVMMARKLSYSYTYANARRTWTEHVNYELNPPYDPQFFEQPPTVRTTPESWRVKGDAVKKP